MLQVNVLFEVNVQFYQEQFAEMGRKRLIRELERELQDQIAELPLERMVLFMAQTNDTGTVVYKPEEQA